MADIQHLNVKIFASVKGPIPWQRLIPVFHRWIREKSLPEMLIDVADYSHVPSGPGVMLIAHEAFYSLDNRESRPGLLYNRRTPFEGTLAAKLGQAYEAALFAAKKLEAEPELENSLRFEQDVCEVSVNDRLLAPNTEATWDELRPELTQFFSQRFGAGTDLAWEGASRGIFRARVNVPALTGK